MTYIKYVKSFRGADTPINTQQRTVVANRDDVVGTLERLGLANGDAVRAIQPLSGGVSSDVFRVDLRNAAPLCVKYAIAQLRVAATWNAPLGRSLAEYSWLDFVDRAFAGSVPEVLGHDAQAHGIAMRYLTPDDHPVWKAELFAGRVDVPMAGMVGERLAEIHARSASRAGVAARFRNAGDFAALRTEPYLRATALRHPDLAARLGTLADRLDSARIALVHGDISPKNILCGPLMPVFIDAECATFGDPAFDIAFLLNHLVIKAMFLGPFGAAITSSALAAWSAYRTGITWEEAAGIEARVVDLLPALMLARVDGKSPLEYLEASQAAALRDRARTLLLAGPTSLHDILTDRRETMI